ncbi:MAG: 50S ribosomal protein L28 [Planctomycetes bacterium]|nr:50S ribosomal protein L28 [Planctomycetota bacterium]
MSRKCEFCGRKVAFGKTIQRRGMAKSLGGVGQKVTGITKRKFKPNVQRVRAVVGGTVMRVRACTRCITSGRVVKPS